MSHSSEVIQMVRMCCHGSHVIVSEQLKNVPGREHWKVRLRVSGREVTCLLTVFSAAPPEQLNCVLMPAKLAEKNAHAMAELPSFGIATPRVLGWAQGETNAALLTEWINQSPKSSIHRIEAACALGRLHDLQLSDLSPDLGRLILESDPKPERCSPIWHSRLLDTKRPGWREKESSLATNVDAWLSNALPLNERRPVHGDCFSANYLVDGNDVRILDWETLGLGDPMWDLAILLGADRGLPAEELEACIKAYEQSMPVNTMRLLHYQNGWELRWRMAELLT
jgi:aminoglycoside phosphotransferase (APT) family kinase protein